MTVETAAVIGTGGIAHTHGHGYGTVEGVDLVACADLVRERAVEFAEAWSVPESGIYEDYETMLREAEPDIVSVCTPPALHADIVVGVARTGVPAAIHCEKPMADTWGNAGRMTHACRRRGIALTFDHQRRFAEPVRRARDHVDAGDIGDLERVEVACPNLYDWGTHLFDMANYCNGDRPAEWVLGQVAYHEENVQFGMHNENQGLVAWAYGNGVSGVASTGEGSGVVSDVGPGIRLEGTEGTIELFGPAGPPGPEEQLRLRRAGGDWDPLDVGGEGLHRSGEYVDVDGHNNIARGIQDAVDAAREGRQSELSAEHALRATEIYFGAYESSRRRGRVELPLDIDDNPLVAMVESGELSPEPSED
jgi:predicted dehydrogenase